MPNESVYVSVCFVYVCVYVYVRVCVRVRVTIYKPPCVLLEHVCVHVSVRGYMSLYQSTSVE